MPPAADAGKSLNNRPGTVQIRANRSSPRRFQQMMESKFSRRSLIKGMTTAAVAPAFLPTAAAPRTEHMKEPVDYVNLNMGGIGQMLTSAIPRVMLPFGAMSIAPMTTPGITDRYTADKVFG